MIIGRATCLSLFGDLQDTTDWVTYKQQKFISHISGVWEVQDQSTCMVVFWWGLIFWFIASTLFLCLHIMNGTRELCEVSWYQSHSWRLHSHKLNTLKSPSSNTIILGIRVSTYEFWGDTDIQTLPLPSIQTSFFI